MSCERYSDIPCRWFITWSASIHAIVHCSLLIAFFGVSCHEEVTILIMLLAKPLHCLLLWIGALCDLADVMRSQVGLGELGGV